MARDRDGRKVCPRSNQAVNFCGYGALMRAAWEIGGSRNYSALIRQVSVLFPVLDFVRLNDDGTQTAVIDAMRDKSHTRSCVRSNSHELR